MGKDSAHEAYHGQGHSSLLLVRLDSSENWMGRWSALRLPWWFDFDSTLRPYELFQEQRSDGLRS